MMDGGTAYAMGGHGLISWDVGPKFADIVGVRIGVP